MSPPGLPADTPLKQDRFLQESDTAARLCDEGQEGRGTNAGSGCLGRPLVKMHTWNGEK